MTIKRILKPTNVRIRLAVGSVLAVLFCIQCTRSDVLRASSLVKPVSGSVAERVASPRVRQLEALAGKDHVALLKRALEHYRDNFRDYTCTFIKRERIDGRLRPEQWVEVKFAEKPFSVAMRWVKNSPIGDRLLYVQGKHNGQMLVNPKGFLFKLVGTVQRDPTAPEVMANTLRPVTMFGFRRSMESLLKVYELATARGEATNRFRGYKEVGGRLAMVLERKLPPRKDYPAKTTVWYLDVEHLVPLGLEGYGWNNELLCSYLYKDIQFNVGLGEEDFTPEANGMKAQK